jgi:hypothetical protein
VADDLVAGAVAELYGADPDAFTERRKALVAAAREAGDRDAATAIGALRKPTRSAWAVNQLARAEPSAAGRLAALAAELRAAERAKDGRRLRELSADRGALIDALTDRALAAAAVADAPSSLREEVTATLTAALADPGTAAAFAAGNLTKAAQWSGFGYADFAPADDPAPDRARSPGAPDSAPVDIASRRSRRARAATEPGSGARPAPRAQPDDRSAPAALRTAPRKSLRAVPEQSQRAEREQSQRAEREQSRREAEEQRAAEEERRAVREAAERAARAREKFDDAERALAQASAVATEAGAAEDRLEAQVRDLEGRLTTARADLAAARRHARHAEAAERRARQALDRTPRPLRRKGLCRHVSVCLV